ncbi:SpoIIE family protein phosphatase [Pseudonocardia nigra]|uniref:SpoIIE family protein phosphatase n=1 Tax=Pseudonocardia nigra TaxID=1921578 RepID=UPI001C5D7724|nr:SpoIIE family protein phosphatase [Pseudonocardia nigra]
MPAARPRVLLVGVIPEVAAALETALAAEVDLIDVAAEEVLTHLDPDAGRRGATVVLIGRELPAPVGMVHAVRPDGIDVAVLAVSTPATEAKLATVPLLFSDDQVRAIPAARADELPAMVRRLLHGMARRAQYAGVRAAAQRQLSAGAAGIGRQVGEQMFGEFLNQAPIGAVMLDDTGGVAAWNHRAAEILDLAAPESLHHCLTALFPSPTGTRLRHHLAHPADPNATFERTRPDGAAQTVRISPQQVLDTHGRERTLVLVEDVTDRVQVERQLAERTSHALLSGDVAAAVTAGGPLPVRLQKTAQATVDRLDAAFARIWVLDPVRNMLHLRASAGLYTHLDGAHGHVPVGALKIGLIAAERRPHLTNSVIGDPRINDQEWARREGMQAFAGYPLIVDEELMGVLGLFARHPLPDTTLDALAGIASQIAVGIRQDRLLQRLSNTAETLQHALLPAALPDLPGLSLAARYLPGAEGVDTGGDWYEVLHLDADHTAFVVGDVVGQGAAAAAMMGQLRSALAAYLLEGHTPARALEHLNHFTSRIDGARGSTTTVMVLDTSTGRLRWACAGHLPPLVVEPRGTPRYLEAGRGPCLAVFDDPPFHEGQIHLTPGSSVLLYTDGLVERRGETIDDGLDRLAAAAAQLTPAAPDLIIDEIMVRMLTGQDRADDTAVIIARLDASGPR